jgi:tRNA (guanine-N7-)-methyltransferase
MQPKHLKFPYRWEERKPVLVDRVLFVPEYYDRHHEWQFPGWETIFGNPRPVIVEYCTGNGTWIAEKAKESSYNWVAVEWRFERVRKIWSKLKNQQLSNLFVVCGEAYVFTHHYLKDHCVDQVYVNFPDPWPKAKHAKNRLFQLPFIIELTRIVKSGGRVTVVTDDIVYGEQISNEMLAHPAWSSVFPSPHYVTEWEGYGASYFDTLWREKGKEPRYFQFKKQ